MLEVYVLKRKLIKTNKELCKGYGGMCSRMNEKTKLKLLEDFHNENKSKKYI